LYTNNYAVWNEARFMLREDDLRIETCWSDFKRFSVKNFMYVH